MVYSFLLILKIARGVSHMNAGTMSPYVSIIPGVVKLTD